MPVPSPVAVQHLSQEQVGDYAIAQGTLAADSNDTIAFTGSTLTITPATPAVTANPQSKVYGTADPALTDTATGFVDATVDGVAIDDTAARVLSGSLSRAQSGRWPASTWAITGSARGRSQPAATIRSPSPATR